jgi:hypothetical protein
VIKTEMGVLRIVVLLLDKTAALSDGFFLFSLNLSHFMRYQYPTDKQCDCIKLNKLGVCSNAKSFFWHFIGF